MPDPGALHLRPPDGYQYGDDHPWTGADQTRLARRLECLVASLENSGQGDSCPSCNQADLVPVKAKLVCLKCGYVQGCCDPA